MRRTFAALLAVSALLLPLAGCDLLSGFLGLGYTVEGTIAFSSSAQTASGTLYVRLLSSIGADHTGTEAGEVSAVYLWQQEHAFRFSGVSKGTYHVLAFIDMDADEAWDPGEPVGGWPNGPANVPDLAEVTGATRVSFVVWMNGAPVAGLPVSIVYDSTSPADIAVANSIRTVLTTNLPFTVPGVTGAMPRFDVTLVAQDSIPSVYDSFYAMPGGADPVVLTPGVTRHGEEQWCHNVATQGKGVLVMGSSGSWFLETANANHLAWGIPGQAPSDIRYMNTWSASADSVVVRNPGAAWGTPLVSLSIPLVDGSVVTLASAAIPTTEAYKAGGAPPAGDGAWVAGSAGDPEHFSVGRQGRFVLFGFEDLPDKAGTAHVLFVNLVKLLADSF